MEKTTLAGRQPLISVIIPCYNGEKFVVACLSSIFNQDYEPVEVIAIDDASTDETYGLLSSFTANRALRIVRHERNMGLAATYSDGLKLSHGDFVLLLHQDCQLGSADWLNNALKHFADSRVALVTGRSIIDTKNMSFSQKVFAFLNKLIPPKKYYRPIETITFSEGKCDLCRKDALVAIGGFPSGRLRISGEDQWISYAMRQKGWILIKDNSLTYKQEITGELRNILKKEFVFGKTQAGITLRYRLFQFSDLNKSLSVKSRAVNRLGQFITALLFICFSVTGIILGVHALVTSSVLTLVARTLFFVTTSLRHDIIRFTLTESLVTSILGVVTDFVYFFGFVYGLFLSIFRMEL